MTTTTSDEPITTDTNTSFFLDVISRAAETYFLFKDRLAYSLLGNEDKKSFLNSNETADAKIMIGILYNECDFTSIYNLDSVRGIYELIESQLKFIEKLTSSLLLYASPDSLSALINTVAASMAYRGNYSVGRSEDDVPLSKEELQNILHANLWLLSVYLLSHCPRLALVKSIVGKQG